VTELTPDPSPTGEGSLLVRDASAEVVTLPGRPYIDVHAHIGDTINRAQPVGQAPEKYLARMAQSGVAAAIPCPAAGGPQARGVLDTRDQNEVVAGMCRERPDRFPIGLGIVEVRHLRAGVDELERSMRDGGLVGFMVHPGISGHAMGPELNPFLEVVDARGGLALLHVGGGGYDARAGAHARRYKNTTFIMAHVSMRKDHFPSSVRHLAGLDNVWVDFAQHPAEDDETWDLAAHVRSFGEDRLLFGSDSPYYDHRLLQRQVEAAAISEEEKDRIAWRNATALIRRFRPGWAHTSVPVQEPDAFTGTDVWAWLPGTHGRLA
jgi:predicted TIM-barrel fold metal-dependent hydrolase